MKENTLKIRIKLEMKYLRGGIGSVVVMGFSVVDSGFDGASNDSASQLLDV
jgi:hypothetical protein